MAGNSPPILAPIGPQTTDEGVDLTFVVTATDPDGPSPALTTSTLPTGATITDHNDGTATFDWTPTFDQAGVYPVTFYATDDSAAVDSEIVQITVNNVNRPPVLESIGPQTTDEGVDLTFVVTATDPDSTIPALTTSTLLPGATYIDHNDGTATFDWTPTFDQAGVYPVTFYATDDSAAVDSEIVQITVNDVGVNEPPVLDPIGPKDTDEGVDLTFVVTASDPDGTIPALTTSTLPTGATYTDHNDGTATFDWTPTFDQAGVYPVTFYATDDSAAVDSEIVQITVNNVNRPPVLDTIAPQTVLVDSLLTFDAAASDPDGGIPSLTVASLPTGADFVDHGDGSGTFTWTPTAAQEGSYQVICIASDGIAADSQSVAIDVLTVAPECGDANGDIDMNIGDPVFIINYIFRGGPAPDPLCLADANGDTEINIGDAVYLISYIFKNGPAPVTDCCQ